MKKYFITGLVILLPVTLTLLVVLFVFNLLTNPFLGVTKAVLARYNLLDTSFLFLTPDQLQTIISKVLILFALVGFTILLGAVTRLFFIHYMIKAWEYIIHRIPLVSSIYKASQDVIKTLFTEKSSAFKQVVLVRFPSEETQAIGLLTREQVPELADKLGDSPIVIFIPTTPNPSSGFLVIAKKSDVIPLDMKIEDAFKYVVSCGVIMTPFKKKGIVTPLPEMPEV